MPLTLEEFARCAIAFVDDTGFCTNDKTFQEKIQKLMDLHTKLHEGTGGKIQKSEILYYCWKQSYEAEVKKLKELEAELIVHEKRIGCVNVTVSARTLGVHTNLAFCWKSQFEVIRKKMHSSIMKLINTDINPYQTAACYNVYVIKSAYFGCKTVALTTK